MLKLLIEEMSKYMKNFDEELFTKAYYIAEKLHDGQKRNSGEPYFIHPCNVALILIKLNMDEATIIAGLLHDVLEDTPMTYEEMEEQVGSEITKLVDGVTKLKKIQYKTKQENQADNIRKMILAMAKDIRVIIIKLADRLHNMRTLEYMTREKQIEKAVETLGIYVPFAERLGISAIKWELENLSFRYLEPEIYENLSYKLKKRTEERQKDVDRIIETLKLSLEEMHIKGEITGRPKSIYSIYKKMEKQNKDLDQIFDLTGIRVIVDTLSDCYGVLGVVHALWRPMPGRFKDYIGMPKRNMYQSIHTTVIGTNGEIFEVQIRTHEMHRTAEYGIAAHWKYKEGVDKGNNFDEKLMWLRQLMDWQMDIKDSREFIEMFKEDFSSDEVFVFSPKADVINLPEGSTPIDFAYRVHSAVGNNCVGAKVDGRIVPLNYKLKTGNVVEILTSASSNGPSKDWLKIVKSSQAKSKIKQWFKKQGKDDNILEGRTALEREVRRLGYKFSEILKEEWVNQVSKKLNFNNLDDMYAAIGFGSIQLSQVLSRLKELHKEYYKVEEALEKLKELPNTEERRISQHGIITEGVDNIQIKLAKCCSPVPGDEIVGYVTRGRGLSVHRKDCSNILNNTTPERFMEVRWDDNKQNSYSVELKILAYDQSGYIAEVAQKIESCKYNLKNINTRSNKDKTYTINLVVEIKSIDDLQDLINKLKVLKGTIDIYRVKS